MVDNHPLISSSAIVSCIHLYSFNRDLVKRWTTDLQPNGPMTRYHALSLLFLIRQNDRMATIKLLQKYIDSLASLPTYAACLLIRGYAKLVSDDPQATKS